MAFTQMGQSLFIEPVTYWTILNGVDWFPILAPEEDFCVVTSIISSGEVRTTDLLHMEVRQDNVENFPLVFNFREGQYTRLLLSGDSFTVLKNQVIYGRLSRSDLALTVGITVKYFNNFTTERI